MTRPVGRKFELVALPDDHEGPYWLMTRISTPAQWPGQPRELGVDLVSCGNGDELFAKLAPPLPTEPPVGTVLGGDGDHVWVRGTDWWYEIGRHGQRSGGQCWTTALELGADPKRVLHE